MSVLDSISGVTAAYSVRKLASAYAGPCMDVRRGGDNAIDTFGFDGSGDLDVAAIEAFVGSEGAGVATWYDQSGNGRHASQPANGNQPLIADAGTLYSLNSRPAIQFAGRYFTSIASSQIPLIAGNGFGLSVCFKPHPWPGGNTGLWRSTTGGGNDCFNIFQGTTGRPWIRWGGVDVLQPLSGYGIAESEPTYLTWQIKSGETASFYADGALRHSAAHAVATPATGIGSFFIQSSSPTLGDYAEAVFFDEALSDTDRQSLEASQATYYGIGEPPPAGPSLLLLRRRRMAGGAV